MGSSLSTWQNKLIGRVDALGHGGNLLDLAEPARMCEIGLDDVDAPRLEVRAHVLAREQALPELGGRDKIRIVSSASTEGTYSDWYAGHPVKGLYLLLLARKEWLLDKERPHRLQGLGELLGKGTMDTTMEIPADSLSLVGTRGMGDGTYRPTSSPILLTCFTRSITPSSALGESSQPS
jgi:hypothetical protein